MPGWIELTVMLCGASSEARLCVMRLRSASLPTIPGVDCNVLARSTAHYRALIGDGIGGGHEPCWPRSRSQPVDQPEPTLVFDSLSPAKSGSWLVVFTAAAEMESVH